MISSNWTLKEEQGKKEGVDDPVPVGPTQVKSLCRNHYIKAPVNASTSTQ